MYINKTGSLRDTFVSKNDNNFDQYIFDEYKNKIKCNKILASDKH